MYVERPPSAGLAGRLACGWHRVSEAAFTQLVVPDACVDLIWGPEGLYVAGPDTGPMPAAIGAGETLAGVRFRPGAVGDFFGVPLHELRDSRVRLSDLPVGPGLLADLAEAAETCPAGPARTTVGARPAGPVAPAERLTASVPPGERVTADALPGDRLLPDIPSAAQPTASARPEAASPDLRARPHLQALVEARVQLLQTTVGRRLTTTGSPTSADPAARALATALAKGESVAEVARHLGYSDRQLQRRSLLAFGYAPKTLQRIVRFQRALRLARSGLPLAEVAATAGYTDQAHLANDVKRLSGVQMSRLL